MNTHGFPTSRRLTAAGGRGSSADTSNLGDSATPIVRSARRGPDDRIVATQDASLRRTAGALAIGGQQPVVQAEAGSRYPCTLTLYAAPASFDDATNDTPLASGSPAGYDTFEF